MNHSLKGRVITVADRNTPYSFSNKLALISYVILTLVFTYPVILHLSSRVIGGGDAYMFLWDIWWFKYAIFTLHTSPLINNTIYYPLHNIPMVWSTPLNELGSLPFQFIFGNLITYNLTILFHFILSGFFAFLFLKKLIKNDMAAFTGGIVYTFSTYHFVVSSGMLGLASIEFIPLFLLFFLSFIDKQSIMNFVFMTGFAALTALSDPSIAVYFLLTFAVVFILYALLWDRKLIFTEKRFFGLLSSGIITAGIVSLFYLPGAETVTAVKSAHGAAQDAILYSEDLLGYFLPTHSNFLWGRFYSHTRLNPAISHYFIGYAVLILTFIGILKSKIRLKGFFVFFFIITLILSLGPYLQIEGPVLFPYQKTYHMIPMPYYVLWKTPLSHLLRFPHRYSLDVELMLSIFVSAALSLFMRRNISSIIATVILAVILPIETTTGMPFNTSDAKIPSLYKTIKTSNNIDVIYDLPSGNEFAPPNANYSCTYMYYQTCHLKPIVYGHTPGPPHHADDFTLLNPLLQVFREPQVLDYGDIIQRDVPAYIPYGISALNRDNISTLILHKTFLSTDFDKNTEKAFYTQLVRIMGKPVFENHSTAMFDVPRLSKPVFKPIVYLGKGWNEPEYDQNGNAYRKMSNDAEIRLSHWKGGYSTVEFSVFRPFAKIENLDVFADATLLAHLDISSVVTPNVGKITIPSVFLHDGENTIVLHVEEGPFEPFLMQSGFPDVNPYSLAISKIKILPVNPVRKDVALNHALSIRN